MDMPEDDRELYESSLERIRELTWKTPPLNDEEKFELIFLSAVVEIFDNQYFPITLPLPDNILPPRNEEE